jgi:hypothetical protein
MDMMVEVYVKDNNRILRLVTEWPISGGWAGRGGVWLSATAEIKD